MSLKNLVRARLPYKLTRRLARWHYYGRLVGSFLKKTDKCCPCCGYIGHFVLFGIPPRLDALCPKCDSLERHRLLVLADRELGLFEGSKSLLHFAPERVVAKLLRARMTTYVTADLCAQDDLRAQDVDAQENLEDMSFEDECFDIVLCIHVLEHVDDGLALAEIHRILRPGGRLIAMVPIVEGWEETYEKADIASPEMRQLHFGQRDHVRRYGADFRERLRKAGFQLNEFTAPAEDAIKYSLHRGEKVFVCYK